MNTYITFACLLAVLGVCHSNPFGYGYGSIIAPAAISSANLYKAPITVIRTPSAIPIVAPAVSTVPLLKPVNVGNWGLGGLGLGGIGYGSLGYGGLGYGLGGLGGKGLGGLGWGGYGLVGSKIIG